jgi:predicted amidohydrolase YtcJ
MNRIPTLLLIFLVHFCSAQRKLCLIKADKIISCDSVNSTYTWALIKDGRIKRLGSGEFKSNEKIKTITFKGVVYPGFIDAHCHFAAYALDKYKCNLYNTSSFEEIIKKLIAYNKTNPYGWIYGVGWNEFNWIKKEIPSKEFLDSLFPNKPVILKRVDGHTVLCNQKALELAHITPRDTIFYKYLIGINKNGTLTGVIKEDLVEKIDASVGPIDNKYAKKALKEMEQRFFENGLCGLVECGIDSFTQDIEQRLYNKKQLIIGNYYFTKNGFYTGKQQNNSNNFLFKGIKVYLDGTLGSKSACLLDHYLNTNQKGILLVEPEKLLKLCTLAYNNNWQLAIHAIGDSANRVALKTMGDFTSNKDLRWRIEHAQVVDSTDFQLFAKYAIIPSVQPSHGISDHAWIGNVLDETKIQNAYQYKRLLNQLNWLPLGTDYPVENINPIATFYNAAFGFDINNNNNNTEIIKPIGRIAALKGITSWAAKSVFEENNIGSIEIGKKANFTVLSSDLLEDEIDKIKNSTVISTFVNGKIVYKKRK